MKLNLFYFNYLIVVLILLTIIQKSQQDLPVHCLSSEIEGIWMIHMGDNHSDKDLKCGHKRPDQNLDHFDVDVRSALKQKHETIVILERPNKVLSVIDSSIQIGKWTMVYDEGVELTIGNQVFFAFSKYTKIGKFSPTNADTEDTPGYKNICTETFLGWYHNIQTNDNWGCYWSEKVTKEYVANLNLNDIDYDNIFKIKALMPASHDGITEPQKIRSEIINENSFNRLPKILKDIHMNPGKSELKTSIKSFESKLSNTPGYNLISSLANQKDDKKDFISAANISTQNDNSYVSFVKSLGWDGKSEQKMNDIPHLDIYFLTNLADSKKSSEFLEVAEETKLFTPDFNYINRINDPKNGYLWEAKSYDDFVGKSYSQMRNLLGSNKYFKNNPNKQDESDSSNFLELEIKVINFLTYYSCPARIKITTF